MISRCASFQRHKPPRCPSATLRAACEVSEDDNMILGRHKILFSVGVVGQLGIHQLALFRDLEVFDWQGGFLRSGSTRHPVKSHLKCGFVDRLAGHNYDHFKYHPHDIHYHDLHHLIMVTIIIMPVESFAGR